MSGLWAALVIVDMAVTYMCFMKGKKAMGWIGVVALVPPLTFIVVIVPIIGAITPAKPGSKWFTPLPGLPPPPPDAWRYTPPHQQADAQPTSSPVDAYMDGQPDPPPARAMPTGSNAEDALHLAHPARAVAIRAFLKQAVADGVINASTYLALLRHLEAPREPTQPIVPAPPPPTPERMGTSAAAAAPPPPPPPVRQPAPAQTAPSPPTAATPTLRPPEPQPPKEPSRFSRQRTEMWEAFTSDVAVHGLAYLGVLLTFVSVLGFLLFAFKDLPISAKPFVELFIVLTFFGWAWLLHRQQATRVAQAMEVLGGMVLPLVWYAALVDSAGIPPDAEGDALVVALTVSSLAISGLYWLISRRYENSMLRFLAWPMVWVAALGVGFTFKADEYLVGDAITRLVAPQPALASVVIAASLVFLRWRSDSRLAGPAYTASLVGIPAAYLLTFGLSLGDSASMWWPIIVSGAGTVASVELVAHWYRWQERLRSLRPYLYGLVAVPLVLAVGIGWGGAIVALSYVALAEMAIRSPMVKIHDVTSAAAGAVVGLILSLAEPGAAVGAFAAVSVWVHLRRRSTIGDERVARSLDGVAALAPIGLLYGLSQLTSVPIAILGVGALVLARVGALRMLGQVDDFDSIWFPAAASALGVGAALFWTIDGTSAAIVVTGLAVSVATVALGRRWPTGNLWLGSALGTLATAIALDALDATATVTAVTWSSIGAFMILMSLLTQGGTRLRIAPGHLSVIGHVIGVFAFTVGFEPLGFPIAMTAWAIGWALSFAASEHRGGVDPRRIWETTGATGHDTAATLEGQLDAIAPTMSAVTMAAAAVSIWIEATPAGDQRVWVGLVLSLVAIAYAAATRWIISSNHGSVVFGGASGVLALAGLGFVYPEPRAIIVAAAAVVVVRLMLQGVLAFLWLTWVSWLMPTVAITALASEMGVPGTSLVMVPIVTGGVMLLGALLLDDLLNERRVPGDLLRTEWLLAPGVLAAASMLVGLGLLYAAGTGTQLLAAASVALTYAATSLVLRRTIWLTSLLGGIGLALVLEAAGATEAQSAVVWAILGLVVLASVPFAKGLPRGELAAIGHLVGAVAFAYGYEPRASLIALTAWAVGWLMSVAADELGHPSVTDIFSRSSIDQVVATVAPSLAVVTSTAAALSLYDEFASFTDARAWTAALVAGMGLLFAAGARYVIISRPASSIFGWSAVVLAAAAVVVAIGQDMPIAVAASAFIVVRILLIGAMGHTWLSWPAWLMPTVIVMAGGHALGVPDDSVYLLSLAAGAVMMVASLVIDDALNTRRAIGEGLRTEWLRYPFVIGLLIVPLSLAPVFALDTTTVGAASLAAALGYLVVAVLLRGGAVTAPAIGLATFGTAVLLPESPLDAPWILVAMAAVVTGWSFLAERMQSTEAAASPWTRWDLPALAMAHLITATAVLLTLDGSPAPATWIAAGALSMVVGAWRRNRWWIDAGLLLVILGSGFAGEPWLFIVLVIATARGMYGVWRDTGVERYVDHAIAVIAGGAAWIDLAMWLDWTYLEIVGFGSVTAGAVAVIAAALSGLEFAKKDTFILWTAIGTTGVTAAMVAGFNARPIAVEGPWVAIGIWLIAATSERWARTLHPNIRYGTPVLAAFGWIVLLTGLGVSDIDSAIVTAVVFGLALLVTVLVTNRTLVGSAAKGMLHVNVAARAWVGVSLAGIAVSTAVAIAEDSTELWLAVASGLALTTVATAIAERALGINRLRAATGAPALGAVTATLLAFDTPPFGIGVAMITIAAVATLSTVWIVRQHGDSGWIESSLVTGLAATTITAPIALIELPATQVAVLLLVAIGGQAISYGIVFNRDVLIAIGPPALGLAAIVLVIESASGSTMWFTVPIAVVLLCEADILHRMTSDNRDDQRSIALLILEWSGMALLGLPPLVEMFTTNIAFGLLGFAFAVGLLAWALLTRVKRRVLAAAVLATLSTMLTLAAAASSSVPTNASFWIIGGGIGFSIMLIAGLVEGYRSRSGALMKRLGGLMEDWE